MVPLAAAAGLLIGLSLGAPGGGGSILTVPVLVYPLGQGPHQAATASLLVVGLAAIIDALTHARAGLARFWITPPESRSLIGRTRSRPALVAGKDRAQVRPRTQAHRPAGMR